MNPATQKTERQNLREKHKSERKALKEKEAIFDVCPVAPQLICVHSFHPASVNYSTAERFPARYSLEKAIEILNAWRPYIIPAQHWKDSCLSIMPDCARSKPPGEFAKLTGESAVCMSIAGGEGEDSSSRGYESHKLEFFARIGERILNVSIEFAPKADWIPSKRVERDDRTGRIISSSFVPRSFGADKKIGRWNPPGSYSFSYYWSTLESWDNWTKGAASHAL